VEHCQLREASSSRSRDVSRLLEERAKPETSREAVFDQAAHVVVLGDNRGRVEKGRVVGNEDTRAIGERDSTVADSKQPGDGKPPVKPSEASLDNTLAPPPPPQRIGLDGSQNRAPDPTNAGRHGVEDSE
jgi:hypothetical protein